MPRWALIGGLCLFLAVLLAQDIPPSTTPPSTAAAGAGDWPMYNRDLMGTRHSPLTQIDRRNVATLRRSWTYKIGPDANVGTITGGSEFTPVVVNGTLYIATARTVAALEGHTGREIWRHDLAMGNASRRGVTYWPGEGSLAPRIFLTSGRRLLALDARSGEPAAAFGTAGEIDMAQPYNGAPTLYRNLLLVGSNGTPGAVRAFDARSGARVWEFRSVPQPGDRFNDTWGKESWKDATGAISWAFSMTVDSARRTLYVVFDSPTPDYYGVDRPGNNVPANSIVALDVESGAYKWHFQTSHHDLWDYDPPSPPGLLDVMVNGRTLPLLAQAGKTGYMYILNRETGQPVFGIDEKPVPAGDVPGEQYSPTQPIPVKPPPIARVSYKPEDLVTAGETNAEHAAFCKSLVERSGGLYNAGPFTPYLHRAEGAPARSTVLFPGSVGGANWGGTASDPGMGYVFVNTMDEGSIGWIEKRAGRGGASAGAGAGGANVRYDRNSVVGGTSRFQWSEGDAGGSGNILNAGARAWPCQKPPWGNLVAVNVKTGAIAWKVPLGVTDTLPEGRRNTGRLNMGGPISTAGGLVFIGASNDLRFRAFDSRNGKQLWEARLEMSAHAVPVTYMGSNGKQYVAIAAGGASAIDDPAPAGSEALVVYSLP